MNASSLRRRDRNVAQVQEAAAELKAAEAAERKAMVKRDRALIRAHGDRRTGGLTYAELAMASGITKGRVIQIVQGRSAYSKSKTEGRTDE